MPQALAPSPQDVDVRSTVPVTLNVALQLGAASTTVTVEGGQDLVENDSTFHTDVDRDCFRNCPWRASHPRSVRW